MVIYPCVPRDIHGAGRVSINVESSDRQTCIFPRYGRPRRIVTERYRRPVVSPSRPSFSIEMRAIYIYICHPSCLSQNVIIQSSVQYETAKVLVFEGPRSRRYRTNLLWQQNGFHRNKEDDPSTVTPLSTRHQLKREIQRIDRDAF